MHDADALIEVGSGGAKRFEILIGRGYEDLTVEGSHQGGSSSASIWEELAPMHTPRTDFALSALNGKLYAISGDYGGQGGKTMTAAVEVYDPAMNEWTQLDDTPNFARCYSTAVTLHLPRSVAIEGPRPAADGAHGWEGQGRMGQPDSLKSTSGFDSESDSFYDSDPDL